MLTLKIVSSGITNVGSSKPKAFMPDRWPIKLAEIKVLCGDVGCSPVGKIWLFNSFGQQVNSPGRPRDPNRSTSTGCWRSTVSDHRSMASQWSKSNLVWYGMCRDVRLCSRAWQAMTTLFRCVKACWDIVLAHEGAWDHVFSALEPVKPTFQYATAIWCLYWHLRQIQWIVQCVKTCNTSFILMQTRNNTSKHMFLNHVNMLTKHYHIKYKMR